MRVQSFIETCLSIMLFTGICLPEDEAFISMNGDCKYPAVATEGNKVYLAWQVTEIRPRAIYFQRSIDEGRTWNSARKISKENGDCMPPSMAANSGILHLVWIDCGEVIDGALYYTRSLDGGDTREKERILVDNVNSAQYPIIACEGSSVYLIWQDVTTQVFFKASHDQGLTWENETFLGKVGKGSCYCFPPAFLANGNEITVVWTDFSEDNNDRKFIIFRHNGKKRVSSVVWRKSTDNGQTWSKERIFMSYKVSKEMKDEIDNPAMFSDGVSSYLFWQDKKQELLYLIQH